MSVSSHRVWSCVIKDVMNNEIFNTNCVSDNFLTAFNICVNAFVMHGGSLKMVTDIQIKMKGDYP